MNKYGYTRTDHWDMMKTYFNNQHPNCWLCGEDKPTSLHHKTYENVYNEDVDDLVPLCRNCHGLIHSGNIIDTDNISIITDDILNVVSRLSLLELKIFFDIYNGIKKYNKIYYFEIARSSSETIKAKKEIILSLERNNLFTVKYYDNYIILDYKDDFLFRNLKTPFTMVDRSIVNNMSKKYSIRLYLLARKFINQGNYTMKIEDFKEYFQVPKSYKMGNIDQNILNPASKELQDKTNINCSVSKRKRGRDVTHIHFNFSYKKAIGEKEG